MSNFLLLIGIGIIVIWLWDPARLRGPNDDDDEPFP